MLICISACSNVDNAAYWYTCYISAHCFLLTYSEAAGGWLWRSCSWYIGSCMYDESTTDNKEASTAASLTHQTTVALLYQLRAVTQLCV